MANEAMRKILGQARDSLETQRRTKAWESHEPIMYVLDRILTALEIANLIPGPHPGEVVIPRHIADKLRELVEVHGSKPTAIREE